MVEPWCQPRPVGGPGAQAGIERFQRNPGITRHGDGRTGLGDFVGIKIDHGDGEVCRPARRGQMADDEIGARAQRQREIRLAEGHGPRTQERQFMVLGNDAPALGCGIERHPGQIDEFLHRRAGARPDNPAAADNQRAFGGGKGIENGVDFGIGGLVGLAAIIGKCAHSDRAINRRIEHIARQVEIDRPLTRRCCYRQRFIEQPARIFGPCQLQRVFHRRRKQYHLIEFLKRAGAARGQWRRATEHNDRGFLGLGVHRGRDHVDRAGASGSKANRRSPGHAGIGEGHTGRRRLMAHANQFDAQPFAFHCQLNAGSPGDVENGRNAARFQGAGKQGTGSRHGVFS